MEDIHSVFFKERHCTIFNPDDPRPHQCRLIRQSNKHLDFKSPDTSEDIIGTGTTLDEAIASALQKKYGDSYKN